MKKAYLVLENGKIFEGKRIGADGETIGELVFTTSVIGYLETLTDPSYAGQIIMQTFPLIGNYGVIPEDIDGTCLAAGYVVHECCDSPSNFRSQYALDTFLKTNGVVGICDVDTREITKILRENGTMTAKICTNPTDLNICATSAPLPVAGRKTKETVSPADSALFRVALIDYGTRRSLVTALTQRGCEVTLFPDTVSAGEISEFNPDGIVLSGGPGNPADMTNLIETVKSLIGKFPVLGIGLGHQLAAIASGGKTFALKCGHRGSNQPVKSLSYGRIYVTNQNHGYSVAQDPLPEYAEITHINVNDSDIEGISYPGKNCFTLQFEPSDETEFLYDEFISIMEAVKENA